MINGTLDRELIKDAFDNNLPIVSVPAFKLTLNERTAIELLEFLEAGIRSRVAKDDFCSVYKLSVLHETLETMRSNFVAYAYYLYKKKPEEGKTEEGEEEE